MKQWGLFIGILWGTCVFGQIRISEPIQDLGDVFENKGKVSTFFELTNPYFEDSILIDNILTPCGCTAVLTEERIILPRSTLKLEVSYDPTNRPGLFVKSLKLETITGKDERNSIYLKIKGNVIAKNELVKDKGASLEEYKVVPLYFYPITAYDTSYLDFNYFVTFINDISYEVDFYQFTTIGFEIEVEDDKQIEELENLMRYTQQKIRRGFRIRGFSEDRVFFASPVFKEAEIPVWALARVKVYSVNFNSDEEEESVIVVSDDKIVDPENLVFRYERFRLPEEEEVLEQLNFERLESKLFVNGSLNLKGSIEISNRTSLKETEKLAASLEKSIYKKLKKSSGIKEENCIIHIDSIHVHDGKKISFLLWDRSDEEEQTTLKFVEREDVITPPLLPTFKQTTIFQNTVDKASREFRHFWENIIANYRSGHQIKILIESSTSHRPIEGTEDKYQYALMVAQNAKDFLIKKFKQETGADLQLESRSLVRGPAWDEKKDAAVYDEFEYLNLVPIVHNRPTIPAHKPSPYQVNFDFFFNGVDTTAIVFNNFSRYICNAVEKDGYVELRIESSISQIPVEKHISNLDLAYKRSYESQIRMKEHLKKKLIDPNRVLIIEERILIQGPKYDGKTPILKYRPYQYLRIIPEKSLRN